MSLATRALHADLAARDGDRRLFRRRGDAKHCALDYGRQERRLHCEMLNIFAVRLDADSAKIFMDGGEALALAIKYLDLGIGLDFDCFPVASELQRAVGERAHEAVVGHHVAQLQVRPPAFSEDQRLA